MEGDQGTWFIAGVAMTLTVQSALFVLWKLAHLRSDVRAERAGVHVPIRRLRTSIGAVHPPGGLEAGSLRRRVRSIETRLDSHIDRHA